MSKRSRLRTGFAAQSYGDLPEIDAIGAEASITLPEGVRLRENTYDGSAPLGAGVKPEAASAPQEEVMPVTPLHLHHGYRPVQNEDGGESQPHNLG
ncbi:MAG: hypothetical protein GC137_06735 [Alphaproteobacteria bacterium]|nr:hypothetical protein [Alphaproteobacteria bacterium]